MFEKLRLNVTRLYGNPGRETQIGGIKVGAWARRKEEYEASCKENRRSFGRSANNPPVHYQFVIATLKAGGNQQRIAFSDGSALNSHPVKAVIQQDFRDSLLPNRAEYCDDCEASDTSRVLANLACVISHNANATSLRTLATSHGLAQDEALLRAVHVGLVWGILCTEGNLSVVSLYQMARDSRITMSDLLDSVALRLTDAGRVWQECSDEARILREQNQRRTRMSQSGSSKIVINNPVGNINVVGKNLYGQTSNFHSKPPNEQVLQALEEILKRSDIPWKSPSLVGVHEPIQRAVRQRDTTHADLRPAVAKLVQVLRRT